MLLFFYNLFFPFALLFSFPFYLRRMLRRGGYARNFPQRFGLFSHRLRRRFKEGGWTWVRAVSVGEMIMALRLLAELKRQDPGFKAIISTTTSTGYSLGRQRTFEQPWIEVIYSPIDFYPVVRSVWRKIRPLESILIDSDLWPSFLGVASQDKKPVFLANARLSPRSEKRYRETNFLARHFFWDRLEKLFAQDQVDAERWVGIGVSSSKIEVTGSMKYDIDESTSIGASRFVDWLEKYGIKGERKILLGGSLHPGEEELLIGCYRALRERFPALFLILVPRHAERTPEIEEILKKENVGYTLRSAPVFDHHPSVLIVNSTGELRDWYYTADVVVVGKSFTGNGGGQNPVEPIAAHKPVIVGPHMENFSYLIQELRRTGGILQLESAEKLPEVVAELLADPEAGARLVKGADQALSTHFGSLRRTAEAILARRRSDFAANGSQSNNAATTQTKKD
jgi:3-deoxy-D-manno-octulosonic-acid transferase